MLAQRTLGLAGIVLALLGFRLANHRLEIIQQFLDIRGFALGIVLDALKETDGNDNRVPIARGNTRQERLALISLRGLLVRHQQSGRRVEFAKAVGELSQRAVLHDDHGLVRRLESAHFHRRGNQREGLARANRVRQQRAFLDRPHGPALLPVTQLDSIRRPGKTLERGSRIFATYSTIE